MRSDKEEARASPNMALRSEKTRSALAEFGVMANMMRAATAHVGNFWPFPIRGRDGRRRDSAVRRRGRGSRGPSADAACATSRSSETGSGHESSGSAWIDWMVRVCAMRNLGI